MPWARIDDSAADHRKFKRAGLEAAGLYWLAVSYCARYLTDGHIDHDWLEERVPQPSKRDRLLEALVEQRLFDRNGSGFVVHDYLDFNPTAEQVLKRRKADADRKASART